MRIDKIKIKNFKGIKNILIKPKAINVLVGRNNTCKTSILEAAYYAVGDDMTHLMSKYQGCLPSLILAGEKESEIIVTLGKESKHMRLSKPDSDEYIVEFKKDTVSRVGGKIFSSIKTGLFGGKSKNKKMAAEKVKKIIDKVLNDPEISIALQSESLKIENTNKKKILCGNNERILKLITKALEKIISKKDRDVFAQKFILSEAIKLALNRFELHELLCGDKKNEKKINFIESIMINKFGTSTEDKEDTSNINKIEKYLKENEILERLIRFDFNNLLFEDENKKEYKVPYVSMGSGFQALVSILSVIKKENKILLIEEPENHMHPEYMGQLISWLVELAKTKKIQIFISTHNFDILDFLVRDMLKSEHQEYLDKELRIIRLQSYGDKDITPISLSRKDANTEFSEIKMDLRGL